jgi:hypothetical protein
MTREQKVNEMFTFLGKYPEGLIVSESHSLGNGDWSLEVGARTPDERELYLFELIGSNGTNGSEPTDLHQQLRDIIAEAKELLPF